MKPMIHDKNQQPTIVEAVTTERLSTTIAEILVQKGGEVWTIAPDESVFAALQKMKEKEVGALLVTSDGQCQGIFSERDYARKVILSGKSSKKTLVSQVMSVEISYARPYNTIADAMGIMTHRRLRHLPILSGDALVGIVSIGDLVKAALQQQDAIIDHLENYIIGTYPV